MSTGTPGQLSRRSFIRRGTAVAGTVGAGALLAACNTGDASPAATQASAAGEGRGSQAGRRVVMVVHDTVPFFEGVRRAFETFAADAGWQTQWLAPPSQDAQQIVALQSDALATNPDGVIFTRIDDSSFDANIEQATSTGIPVVLSNVASAGYRDLGVPFVGQSFIPAGRIHGQQAAKHAQEVTGRSDGLIVMTNAVPGNSALEERLDGTAQGIEQYNEQNGTNFTSEALVTATDEAEMIGRVEAKWRAAGDDIVAWAPVEYTGTFIATWASNQRLIGTFAIGAFDIVDTVLADMEDDRIQWTVGQNPWAQGYIAAALLAMEMSPGFQAFDYDTGAEVVDASNIERVAERERRLVS